MQIEVSNSKDMWYLKKMCSQKYYKWIVLKLEWIGCEIIMEELLNQLLTRDNIAELCRICETMIYSRRINTYNTDEQERKGIPQTVREYNKELMKVDCNIFKILIDVKKELKKAKYNVYGVKEDVLI